MMQAKTIFTQAARRTALAAALAASLPVAAAQARSTAFDTQAANAIVMDAETRAVLMAKDADAPIPPASMSKLMTAELAFEALSDGRLSLEERFPVSENAFRKEGSKMFLNLGDEPTVAELLRGLIVQSGNDAAIALAEAIAGSEAAFAKRMNARAEELGLRNSRFANATGLPHPEHRMSARDLALLSLHMIETYPDLYTIYSEREFEWAGVLQKNRNPLLYLPGGGDGLKTGYTDEAGYGIVGSATRDGRRVVAVLAGFDADLRRRQEIQRVISWAFRDFETVTLAEAGDVIGAAEVWLGARDSVPLTLAEPLKATLPRRGKETPQGVIRYKGPLTAPVAKGAPVGVMTLRLGEGAEIEREVITAEAVEKGGYGVRLAAGVDFLLRYAGVYGAP